MKIFVTGAAGFIGSHYVRSLLGDDGEGATQVTAFDKLTYAGNTANLPLEHPRLSFVRGDVCDSELLREVLPGHDAVVHFAAESHVDRSLVSGTPFVTTNVLGTQTLLEACLHSGVHRIVHVSTDEVYGSVPRGRSTEESILKPNSPYAASKAASDMIARAYWRSHDLQISITRCSNNYGPHQFVEKVIPLFVTNLIDNREVPLYGDGHQVRDWLHVSDHCRAVHTVLCQGRAGEIYNIGSDNELTNRELTERLIELCGADWSRVRHVLDRKAHDERYALDSRKVREELGFVPRVSIDKGLAEVVAWYRDNRTWWEPMRRAKDSQLVAR